MSEVVVKKSDLGVRTASAIVMLFLVYAAWLGGAHIWSYFVLIVGLVCFWEFGRLILTAFAKVWQRILGTTLAAIYVSIPVFEIAGRPFSVLYHGDVPNGGVLAGAGLLIALIGVVIATDVGAYFAGRMIGGPKIAPKISPSKTWAGLLGGMLCASLWSLYAVGIPDRLLGNAEAVHHITSIYWLAALVSGAVLASVAQAGDFFESWLKRRAGVKDSSRLIPGHGGVFDRIDGLLAVALVSAISGDWLIFGELLRQ